MGVDQPRGGPRPRQLCVTAEDAAVAWTTTSMMETENAGSRIAAAAGVTKEPALAKAWQSGQFASSFFVGSFDGALPPSNVSRIDGAPPVDAPWIWVWVRKVWSENAARGRNTSACRPRPRSVAAV